MNASQWADKMAELFEDMKNGKISVQAACAGSELCNSASQQMSLQLRYHDMRGETPNLDFFKG